MRTSPIRAVAGWFGTRIGKRRSSAKSKRTDNRLGQQRPGKAQSGKSALTQGAVSRRKILIALGFGATNVAVLRKLGAEPESVVDTPTTTTVPAVTTAPRQESPEVPVLDGAVAQDVTHDLVITGGRVIDPESEFDAVANVGIVGSTISVITVDPSPEPLRAQAVVQADGLVVAPGFIDILSYSPNGYGEWYKLADGVTTNLGMHGLNTRAAAWFNARPDGSYPVHFGGAYDHSAERVNLGLEPYDTADANAIQAMVRQAELDLADGFIGLHMEPEYVPGTTTEELLAHGRLAAAYDVPLCVHARYSDNLAPGTNLDAMRELIMIARETGTHVHVEHINSTGGTGVMSEALAMIESGRSEGLRLTACVYPYEFWATYLRSARFNDWQEKYSITYGDLQVAGTNQRLTEATFADALEQNALTAAFAIPAEDIAAALQADFVMVGSDAILEPSHQNHPRAVGCFSRILRHYVRELEVLDLPTALAKMTSQPAQLLRSRCVELQRKGRVAIGADADLTIFDPIAISDQATINNPAQPSVGVEWVLVEGQVLKTPGVDVVGSRSTGLRVGRGLRSDI